MAYDDNSFLPAAQALLGCLALAVSDLSQPPAQVGLRNGESMVFDLSQNEDLCCEGFAWVRMGTATPFRPFGQAAPQSTRCRIGLWSFQLEMGIVRCAPMGDDLHVVDESEHTRAALLLVEDFAALRRALCCFGDQQPGWDFEVDAYTPAGPAGGCMGAAITISVQIAPVEGFGPSQKAVFVDVGIPSGGGFGTPAVG